MPTELAKAFDPKDAQRKWLKFWDDRGYFHSEPDPDRQAYTIVIPPPNVTGALHMGHALNNTLQDVLIRWRRMQGYNTLWMPGTDHAGIATQAVVERLIFAQEKKTRHELGREELVKRIWLWKDKYEARIIEQLREMGASCDWSRVRFTLDEVCVKAVRETFYRMFKDGYIYRGKRLVNWDAQLQTSVADDETYTEDTKGGFWTFRYPVNGMPDTFIRFSTTRPETMLGDTAICVHPSDDRYKHLIGKTVTIPLNGRVIPIIADGLLADPTLGTGCVKVTPAHDPNDYGCYTRHPEIGIINILNPDGTINDNGGKYSGMDRYKVREAVIQEMESLGHFEGCEERIIPLKYSDRSKTPIEPYLSDQWFVKMGDRDDGKPGLAQLSMDAVTSNRVQFFPDRYAKSYLDWLSEKRDWCISRQLWWGHRIAVWSRTYPDRDTLQTAVKGLNSVLGPIGQDLWASQGQSDSHTLHICLRSDEPKLIHELEAHGFTQSDDVLDTWFSSALWPHSTLGWPGPGKGTPSSPGWPYMAYYYPTSVLVTNRDIITLWVARMVLTGLYNVGEVPFRHVFIHPKVMDAFGEGMSKSKGNGVDPLDIIEMYGADAMRFVINQMATETQDSRLPVSNVCPHCGTLVPLKREHMSMRTRRVKCPGNPADKLTCGKEFRPGGPWPSDDPELPTAKQASDRFEVGRNFANKLWNATRFILMNLDGYTPASIDVGALPTEDRWIISRLATTASTITTAFEQYEFSKAAAAIYEFAWSEFCDWYIEMSKGRLKDPGAAPIAQRVLVGVLDGILRLVQPVMPFVAESLWQALNEAARRRGVPRPIEAEESVVIAAWPEYPADWQSPDVEARFARMQDLVRGVREVRNRYQVHDRNKLDVCVKAESSVAADFNALATFIGPLAGIASFKAAPETAKPKQSAAIVRPDFEAFVSLAGLIDVSKEVERLTKQLSEKRRQLDATRSKLANEKFVSGAPADVVEQQRALAADLGNQIRAMEESLADLQAD